MKLRSNLLCLTLFVTGFSLHFPLRAQQITRKVKETLLARIDNTEMTNTSLMFSNNMNRIAYLVHNGNKQMVVIDGIKGKGYDSVCAPVLVQMGKHSSMQRERGKSGCW